MKSLWRSSTSLGALALFASSASAAAATEAQTQTPVSEPTAGDKGTTEGGEIIVTATRRARSIMSVPVSIRAVGAEEIERRGAKDMEDLSRAIPGLLVQESDEQNDKVYSIRGVGTSAQAATVAVYLDDTPLTFGNQSPDLKLVDVARVEVLRGPQGTLFGASSMGGAIRYISPAANLTELEGSVRVEGSANSHGGMNYEGQAVLSGPLAPGKIAFRGSGFYRHDGGYIDLRDEDTGEIIRHNINTIDSFGGRLALSGSLGERADATLSVLYQSEDHDAVNSSFSGRGVSNTVPLPPRSRVARGDNFRKDRTFLPNLTVNGDLGFAKLTSSSSYINRSLKIGADFSYFVQAALGIPDPFPLVVQDLENRKFEGYVEEVRLASTSQSQFEWLLGGYYRHTKEQTPQSVPSNLGVLIPDLEPLLLANGSVFERDTVARRDQMALFGEGTLNLGDRFRVTGGLRASVLKLESDREADGLFNGGFSEVHLRSKERPVTPKISVQYRPSPLAMVYATAAKGFREGGPNAPVPAALPACVAALAALGRTSAPDSFKTDTLWSYELGAKVQTHDHRLRATGAVYQINWSGIQQSINLSGGCGFDFIDNVGKARSRGGEVEASWQPTSALLFDLGAGYTNAELTEDLILGANSSGPIIAAPAGTRLADVPKWTLSTAGQYTFPLFGERRSFFRAEFQHIGAATRHLNTPSDDPRSLKQSPYDLVNLRLGLVKGDNEVDVFVNNLLDDDTTLYKSFATFAPGTAFESIRVRPRVVGASYKRLF